MSSFTKKSADICVTGNWDSTLAISPAPGAAAAAASAVLPASGTAGETTYITGFQITSTAPAATVSGLVTVTGLTTAGGGSGTLNYEFVESATLGGNLSVAFANPIPANAVNAAITVSVPAITSGGVVAVSVQGYQTAR